MGASRSHAEADRADVLRVLAGETAAFEGIVRRWQGPLINLAYRFCRDRGRAEDMAQEAFLRAYRGLPKWRGDSAFSTWLFALAINLYRSEQRRIPASLPLEDIAEPKDPRAIDGGLEGSNRDEMVRRAVDTLPEKYREALIGFYFQEMDLSTAAAGLGIAEGTLKARLFRGRKMLESKLPSLMQARRIQSDTCSKETV